MTVTADRFPEYFKALHGTAPFPWQAELAARAAAGAWPSHLKLPTASGKTAALDIAVYALAVQALQPASRRTAPRRIVFCVDRRVIVDEAFARAQRIADRLRAPDADGIVYDVAEALRALSGGRLPLACYQLRGGMYRDDDWARTPTQPVILTSTVDQLGSRLLFRSYGSASPYTWPIHAGLTAYDTLILLDEAHCAEPFRQTVESIAHYRRIANVPLPAPFHVVTMTATSRATTDTLELSADDRAHPVLRPRLEVSKPALLCVAGELKPSHENDDRVARESLVGELVAQALRLAAHPQRKAIGILVNRVATARAVYGVLREAGQNALLLIGGMRPFDRDREQSRDPFRQLLADYSAARDLAEPVFVVATQTLEVGANLDFDALVTECASLDALRQRFGRLNRMGRPGIPTEGAIVIRGDQIKPTQDSIDPVYGLALPATWRWLQTLPLAAPVEAEPQMLPGAQGSRPRRMKAEYGRTWYVDLGILALESALQTLGDGIAALELQLPDAPVLLPAHLDAWAQTSPAPLPTPDPAVFLHGIARGRAEVRLVWRSDLTSAMTETQWIETVALCPPTSAEAMTAPLQRVLQWLADAVAARDDDQADIEGLVAVDSADRQGERLLARRALIWRGPDDSALAFTARDVQPNDTLILASDGGGWDAFGHIPEDSPRDVAEAARWVARREPLLRLYPILLEAWPATPARSALQALLMDEEERLDLVALRRVLTELVVTGPMELHEVLTVLADPTTRLQTAWGAAGWVVRGQPARVTPEDDSLPPFTDEDDSASLTGSEQSRPASLEAHCAGVAAFAFRFATLAGLPDDLVRDFELAGRLHDAGKADPRFQDWLYGTSGLRFLPEPRPLVAKSKPVSPEIVWQMRTESGYPKGARHELLSVHLVGCDATLQGQAHDWELVLHLIASHHGRCRPFAPVVVDDAPAQVDAWFAGHRLMGSTRTDLEQVDSGVAERFWRLTRRYGWWGLAYLEAIFRLADHRQSQLDAS